MQLRARARHAVGPRPPVRAVRVRARVLRRDVLHEFLDDRRVVVRAKRGGDALRDDIPEPDHVHVPDVFETAARGQPAADGDGVHVLLARGGAVCAVERDAAAELRGLVLRGGRARDVRRADRRLPLWGERGGVGERGDHAARGGLHRWETMYSIYHPYTSNWLEDVSRWGEDVCTFRERLCFA